jgi:hypothetical protein
VRADDYRFTVRRFCFCSGSEGFFFIVQDSDATNATDANRAYSSIPLLFARIQDAIESRAVSFEAAYDPVTGVPLRVSTNQADYVVDDTGGFGVSSVRFPDRFITSGTARARLKAARKRWREVGVRDYTYRVFTHCPCRGGGDAFHDFEVRDGRPVKSGFGYRAYETIPALFRYIAKQIDAREPVLRVRYGASGRPRRIYTDSGEEANVGGNPGQFTIRTYRFRVSRR